MRVLWTSLFIAVATGSITVRGDGMWSSITTYDTSDSCSQPAGTMSLEQEVFCKEQDDHDRPLCDVNGAIHVVNDCFQYTRWRATYYAFGQYPRFVVEEYDPTGQWCSDPNALVKVTAYLMDENCHVNHLGTRSSKLTLGRSVTLTQYDDPNCNAVASETTFSFGDIMGESCSNYRLAYYEGNMIRLSSTAVFDDSGCSEEPVKLTFTTNFGACGNKYEPNGDNNDTRCVPDGSTHFSISGCDNGKYSPAFADTAASMFGNDTAYLIVEEFANGNCYRVQNVTVFVVDGVCHSNTDNKTSFRVTLTASSTVEIVKYADAVCGAVAESSEVSKRMLASHSCISSSDCSDTQMNGGCSKRFSVGGPIVFPPTILKSVIGVYSDKSCSATPSLLAATNNPSCSTPIGLTCDVAPVTPYSIYQELSCTEDVAALAALKYGSVPYLIVEKYAESTKCQTQESILVYKVDGKCHPNIMDGTYFKITPSFGNSLTIATYSTSSCSNFDAEYSTVGTKFINSGRRFNGNQKLYANMSALFVPAPPDPTPMLDVDSMTREQIMFPEWLWEPTPRRVFESD